MQLYSYTTKPEELIGFEEFIKNLSGIKQSEFATNGAYIRHPEYFEKLTDVISKILAQAIESDDLSNLLLLTYYTSRDPRIPGMYPKFKKEIAQLKLMSIKEYKDRATIFRLIGAPVEAYADADEIYNDISEFGQY